MMGMSTRGLGAGRQGYAHQSSTYKLIGLWVMTLTAVLLGTAYSVFYADAAAMVAAIGVAGLALVLTIRYPEMATWVVVFVLYTNLAAIAVKLYGVPSMVAASFALLLVFPLADHLFGRKKPLRLDLNLVLMLLLLIDLQMAAVFAVDFNIAMRWIWEYLTEGIILYFLLVNVIRSLEALKRVIWVLLIAAGLLGSLSLFQEVTQSYDMEFGGLAQRNVEYWTDEHRASDQDGLFRTREKVGNVNRARGPVDDPNRFSQILLMVLPLGVFIFWQGRSGIKARVAAGAVLLLGFCGVLVTYSRGAFVTCALLSLFVAMLGYIRFRQLAIGSVLLALIVLIAAPGYVVRMQSILGAQGLVSETAEVEPDAVTRGRVTEMLAALNVFLDYPVTGVGPGQYAPFYSVEYMQDPEIAYRDIDDTRRAHTLYFEFAAETGIFGIGIFGLIVFINARRLLHYRRRYLSARPDLAHLATALLCSLIAFLSTSIFLHLAFQRYLWLMLAIIGASLFIMREAENGVDGAPDGRPPLF
ncbi:MAG: O-antigen ligase family protein [Pseudomonadota bacterium]|nr:O-antigen ligase family protein [Pseudomonadota bacterium]